MKPRLLFQLPATSCGWIAPSVSPDSSGLPVTKIRTTTIATIPMCHHTLTWLSSATRLMPAMLRPSWIARITPIVTSWPLRTPWMNSVVLNVPPVIRSTMVALRKPAAA